MSQTMSKFYKEKGMDIWQCRGQYYNGATDMQSLKRASQAVF